MIRVNKLLFFFENKLHYQQLIEIQVFYGKN